MNMLIIRTDIADRTIFSTELQKVVEVDAVCIVQHVAECSFDGGERRAVLA